MALALDTNFDPGRVFLGSNRARGGPYLPISPIKMNNGTNTASTQPAQVPRINQNQDVLNPEAVRATGTGPYDPAYRQNLATYAGGQFSRPGGSMNFNPTDLSSFPGNPVGGGNAPLPGLPDSLVSQALGGNPFSFQPSTQNQQPSQTGNDFVGGWQDWLRRFRGQGRMFALME